MPTLIRLMVFLVTLAVLAYGAMFALATFVRPSQHEIRVELPPVKPGK